MRRHQLCVRTFPRAWRERYEAEVLELLAQPQGHPWREAADLVRAGLAERCRGMRAAPNARIALLLPALVAAVVIGPAMLAPTAPLRSSVRAVALASSGRALTLVSSGSAEIPRSTAPRGRAAVPRSVASGSIVGYQQRGRALHVAVYIERAGRHVLVVRTPSGRSRRLLLHAIGTRGTT